MKRILAQLAILTISVLLSSCLEMTSVITVSKDGTAIIEETVLASPQLKAMMSAGGAADQPGAPSMKDIIPDREKAAARAKKLGDGVTVKAYEPIKMPDGREGVKITYAVEDITDVEYEPFESDKKEAMDPKDAHPITFEFDDDELTVSLPLNSNKDEKQPEKPKVPKEQMEAQLAMMKPMFAGMRITLQIKSASGIASSDATNLKGDTVTIMDLQFDKIMEKPESFIKFMDSADDKNMTPAKAAEMFKGVDGIKIEAKEEISITLK